LFVLVDGSAEENRTEGVACFGKSEAEVTSNKRLQLMYCAVEAN